MSQRNRLCFFYKVEGRGGVYVGGGGRVYWGSEVYVWGGGGGKGGIALSMLLIVWEHTRILHSAKLNWNLFNVLKTNLNKSSRNITIERR